MLKHPSTERQHRRSLRSRERNRRNVSRLRTALKTIRALIEAKNVDESRANLKATISLIDHSISKKALHRNAAARLKSRLTRQVNGLQAQPS